ncbi:hypothetical protein V6Z12_A11G214100 [Gossypium hirsutum]
MRKSSDGANNALQRHIVFSFGDHYYFRKELKILNLLTGFLQPSKALGFPFWVSEWKSKEVSLC